METDDIVFLLKYKIWISCSPKGRKWEMIIYEKQKARWLKRKRKLFSHPAVAYIWAQEYLLESYTKLL